MKTRFRSFPLFMCPFMLVQHCGAFIGSPMVVLGGFSRPVLLLATSPWSSMTRRPPQAVTLGGLKSTEVSSPWVSELSMSVEPAPLDRRGIVRVVASWITGVAAASTAFSLPRTAEAAAIAAIGRRPLAKRKLPALCDDAVSYLRNPAKESEVWIVGTAHISDASALLVGDVIREIKPQVVMVELDEQRVKRFIQAAEQEDDIGGAVASSFPVADRRAEPIFGAFLAQLLDTSISVNDRITDFFAAALGKVISKMYDSLGQQGFTPGQEFTVAIREARRCGAKILLGDRSVQDTLRRLSQALQKTDLEELALKSQAELGINLEGLDFGTAETIGEKAEKLKNRATMTKLVNVYKEDAPELYMALIGERDKVMAVNLMTLGPKQTTVAVVGLAHVDGIEAILAVNGWRRQRC